MGVVCLVVVFFGFFFGRWLGFGYVKNCFGLFLRCRIWFGFYAGLLGFVLVQLVMFRLVWFFPPLMHKLVLGRFFGLWLGWLCLRWFDLFFSGARVGLGVVIVCWVLC